MALYTRRIQATLTEEQYRELLREARARHLTVSELVRQTLERQYFTGSAVDQRRTALDDLLAIREPAVDWPEMEAQIERGAREG